MSLIDLLEKSENEIIDAATAALDRTPLKHYKKSGIEENKQRLKRLYHLLLESLKSRNLIPLTDYIREIANERFMSGYDINEVLTAINVLEETVWGKITKELQPSEFPEAIGLVSTILGAGKSSMASTYVSLASKTSSPALDLSALFKGTEGS